MSLLWRQLWWAGTDTTLSLLTSPSPIQGLVLAVGANCGVMKLYDTRNYDKGPFATFVVGPCPSPLLAACRVPGPHLPWDASPA